MIDLNFSGFVSLPGSCLGECLDAAGIDVSLAGPARSDGAGDATLEQVRMFGVNVRGSNHPASIQPAHANSAEVD